MLTKFSPFLSIIYLLSALAALSGLQQLWTITFWPFQHEYREAAMATSTYGLSRGLSPFSWELQPRYTNVYGPLLPLVTWLFTPEPHASFTATRCVASVMILVNTLVLGGWVWRTTTPILAVPASTLFLFQQLFASSGAFSTSLGMFFFIAPLAAIDTLPAARKRPWIVIPAAIAGFLSKPYCAMVLGVGGILILVQHFRQKAFARAVQASMLFLVISVGVFGLIVAIYAYSWPPLFTNTILHHRATARFDPNYRALQLHTFWNHNWILLTSLVSLALIGVCAAKKHALHVYWDLICEPAVVAAICTGVAFYRSMGGHSGSAPTYYLYHIFMPFFLVAWCKLAYYVANSFATYTSTAICGQVATMTGAALMLSALMYTPALHRKLKLTPAQQESWRAAQDVIESSNLVLHSPTVTSLITQSELPLFDSGQTEYFTSGAVTPRAWRFALPDHSRNVYKHARAFSKQLMRDVKTRRFDALILTQGGWLPVSPEVIQEHYEVCRTVELAMPLASQSWVTKIYRRRGMC